MQKRAINQRGGGTNGQQKIYLKSFIILGCELDVIRTLGLSLCLAHSHSAPVEFSGLRECRLLHHFYGRQNQ